MMPVGSSTNNVIPAPKSNKEEMNDDLNKVKSLIRAGSEADTPSASQEPRIETPKPHVVQEKSGPAPSSAQKIHEGQKIVSTKAIPAKSGKTESRAEVKEKPTSDKKDKEGKENKGSKETKQASKSAVEITTASQEEKNDGKGNVGKRVTRSVKTAPIIESKVVYEDPKTLDRNQSQGKSQV